MANKLCSLFKTIFITLLVFPLCGNASEGAIAISHRVVLEPGVVPHVNTMVRAADGGFLIAGAISSLQQGWATRTDAIGNVLWRYTLSPHVSPPYQAFYPEYFDAISMPKGDSFLCGRMPVLPHGEPALLTHLDAEGKLIREQVLSPKDTDYFGGSMERCVPFGEGFVGIGVRLKHETGTGAGAAVQNATAYYWLVYFDANGDFLEENFFKSNLINIDQVDILNAKESGGVLLVGQRGTDATEIVYLSPQKKIASKKIMPGRFRAIQPVEDDGLYQFVSSTADPITVVTLNSQFEEIKRLTKNGGPSLIRRAYRLPNGSIALFGEEVSSFSHNYRATAAYLDKNLNNIEENSIADAEDASCCDGATLFNGSAGVFVNVRSSMKRVRHYLVNEEIVPVGVVFNFIEFK